MRMVLTLKQREPRRKVLLWARTRAGSRRADVRIVDISKGGLCLSGSNTHRHGDYVELQRGCHTIIARVVWSHAQTFRLIAQDRIPVDALISDPDRAGAFVRPAADARSTIRHLENENRSRFVASAIQAGAVALIGACAALLAVSLIHDAFARPMHAIAFALDGR